MTGVQTCALPISTTVNVVLDDGTVYEKVSVVAIDPLNDAKVTGNRKSTGKVIRTTTGLMENIRGIKYRWILNMFQTNVSGSHAMGSNTVRLPRLINTVGNAS